VNWQVKNRSENPFPSFYLTMCWNLGISPMSS